MAYEVHQGIVLRTYIPHKQKLSLLDAYLGRIDCVPQSKNMAGRLFHGAYISYAVKPWGTYYIAYDISLLEMPGYCTEHNFLFFHHLLELCRYFLPVNNQENEVFGLVKLAYTRTHILQSAIAQKIFLCHFFRYLSIYPADLRSYGPSFIHLISGPFDSKVNAEDEEKLNRWLRSCVSNHPYAYYLKTIDFLKK